MKNKKIIQIIFLLFFSFMFFLQNIKSQTSTAPINIEIKTEMGTTSNTTGQKGLFYSTIQILQKELNDITKETKQGKKNNLFNKLTKSINGLSLMNKSEIIQLKNIFNQAITKENFLTEQQKNALNNLNTKIATQELIAPEESVSIKKIVKQIPKERDIVKKIDLIKQALSKYYILANSKLAVSKKRVSQLTGRNITTYLLSMIRSASRYTPEQINALVNFLQQSIQDKTITALPDQRVVIKIKNKYINNLEIKALLQQARAEKTLAGKVNFYTQAVNKLNEKSKHFDKTKIFFEINALIKNIKTPEERGIISPLLNALNNKNSLFIPQQRNTINTWIQQK